MCTSVRVSHALPFIYDMMPMSRTRMCVYLVCDGVMRGVALVCDVKPSPSMAWL